MINTFTINKHLEKYNLPSDQGYSLVDNGSGEFIDLWNLDIPKPTSQELEVYYSEYIKQLELNSVIKKRQSEYPNIGDQLDAILKWVKTFDKEKIPNDLQNILIDWEDVKKRNPKPDQVKSPDPYQVKT